MTAIDLLATIAWRTIEGVALGLAVAALLMPFVLVGGWAIARLVVRYLPGDVVAEVEDGELAHLTRGLTGRTHVG